MRRFSGGPGFVVPHGVVVPHGLDVGFALVGVVVHDVGVVVDRRQLVGVHVDRLRDRGGFDLERAAPRLRRARAAGSAPSPSTSRTRGA